MGFCLQDTHTGKMLMGKPGILIKYIVVSAI